MSVAALVNTQGANAVDVEMKRRAKLTEVNLHYHRGSGGRTDAVAVDGGSGYLRPDIER